MLHRIIYISSATHLFDQTELDAVLKVSRRNNGAAGITGVMLSHEGAFFQVLEGPQTKVEACFARILADSRHRGLIRLWEGAVEARAFPDWQMGLARIDTLPEAERGAVVSLQALVRGDVGQAPDPVVRMLTTSFLRGFRDLGDTLQAQRA